MSSPNGTRYESVNDLWTDALNQVQRYGEDVESRVGPARELIPWSGTIEDASKSFLTTGLRLSPEYAAGELAWYLSGKRSAKDILAYAPRYKRFLEEDDIAWGAYGHRWSADPTFLIAKTQINPKLPYTQDQIDHGAPLLDKGSSDPYYSQLKTAIEILKSDKMSRQVVLTLYNAGDLAWSHAKLKRNIPCTVCLQFLLRHDRLHAISYSRSQDLFIGFPYDVFAFCAITRIVALGVGVEVGSYTHNVGSLHLYKEHAGKTNPAAYTGEAGSWATPKKFDLHNEIKMFGALERKLRRQQEINDPERVAEWWRPDFILQQLDYNINCPMLYDLLLISAIRFIPENQEVLIRKIRSESVKAYVKAWKAK